MDKREPKQENNRSDNHYIPNANNAHLDLQCFKDELRSLAEKSRRKGVRDEEIVESFYHHALDNLNKSPDEPDSDVLICRFLTPKKFLWFVSNKYLRFCVAQEFDDPRECSLPEDYDISVRAILFECKLPASEWDNQVWSKGQECLKVKGNSIP